MNAPSLLTLLQLSVKHHASDLHITAQSAPLFRIDGDLRQLFNLPILDAETIVNMIDNLLDENQKKKFDQCRDFDFSIAIAHVGRFRVNIFYQMNGVAAVFRVIPLIIPTLEQLHTPNIVKKILNLSSGLILITGPTGSGKSSTLAAMIHHLNETQQMHIITIEDPIEFTHTSKKSLIHQRQVFRDTTSFSSALRSALREDPDVILVGEIRDLETVRLSLTAAETGHLVMATLHASSAPRAISRIIDLFPADEKIIIRNLISESLQAIICQALIKKLSGGRVAAYEILLGTQAVRNLIREDKIAQMYSVLQTNAQVGMCTMQQSIQELATKKLIDITDTKLSSLNKNVIDPLEFQMMV